MPSSAATTRACAHRRGTDSTTTGRRDAARKGEIMGIDSALLERQCQRTIQRTSLPELGTRIEGKVRDSYLQDGRRILVATDRISAFDVVLGTIPFKGQVLNQLAAFWFERTRSIAPNHVIAVPDPCVTVARECQILPVEFVFRGYLTGVSKTSIWTAYERGERVYCGHRLPDGLRKHERLPAPLLTPTTKAGHGEHDELTSRDELIRSAVVCEELYDRAAEMGARLFAEGQRWAGSRGLILVDTKYEMGIDSEGNLVVVDEIHTPDSSRYWYADTYARAMSAGEDPTALDKEYVRRWLTERGWRGEGPPPELPVDVRCEAGRRYIETYERLTGQPFVPSTEEPMARIRRNLGLA
jgi:phosphoribosylaminoimidazole-succinocarboxamide synthase